MDVTVALDWTPNTNHAGFYVAADRGAYADAGLDVTLESPALDGYERTPARKVAEGEADFAVAPSESAVSYATLDRHDSLVAVAALVQGDTSAVAVLADSDIERPRDLDGATYASYGARFEDHIVAQLIRNDGGEGTFETVEPEMLGVPNTLLDGDADATWVFMPWEGVRARRDGIDLRGFGLSEYDVPYGYTPVLLAHPDTLDEHGDAVREFLAATAEGYEAAAADPEGRPTPSVGLPRAPTSTTPSSSARAPANSRRTTSPTGSGATWTATAGPGSWTGSAGPASSTRPTTRGRAARARRPVHERLPLRSSSPTR
ncbi:ABC transporter substrate-binding protein [Halosegnis marinus]|uniref:ABC transporter substrate-binding protein n=1 Tax=Halosegnis marinus TaxID=3034023 RepID=UPI003620F464